MKKLTEKQRQELNSCTTDLEFIQFFIDSNLELEEFEEEDLMDRPWEPNLELIKFAMEGAREGYDIEPLMLFSWNLNHNNPDLDDFKNAYMGEFEDVKEYVETLFFDLFEVPEAIASYIDLDQFQYNLEREGSLSVLGEIYVFNFNLI